MLGTEAASAGFNFTAADTVCLYDEWWSNTITNQAIDRCHRIGQKNTVTVIRFVCKDTIEQRIRDVLRGKAEITNRVLEDGVDFSVVERMSAKDMARLL
jgi:SNF2 family DNA or RNA helicase